MPDNDATSSEADGAGPHPAEPHHDGLGGRLNWLRAAVLGTNDGVVSTAGLVALIGCGWGSARLGNGPIRPAVVRNAAGGAIAMAVTYAVGVLLDATGI